MTFEKGDRVQRLAPWQVVRRGVVADIYQSGGLTFYEVNWDNEWSQRGYVEEDLQREEDPAPAPARSE